MIGAAQGRHWRRALDHAVAKAFTAARESPATLKHRPLRCDYRAAFRPVFPTPKETPMISSRPNDSTQDLAKLLLRLLLGVLILLHGIGKLRNGNGFVLDVVT